MDVTHNDWEEDKPSDAKRFRVRILSVTLLTNCLYLIVFKSAFMKFEIISLSGFIFFFLLLSISERCRRYIDSKFNFPFEALCFILLLALVFLALSPLAN